MSPPRIVYLHGFASSPQSRKAVFFHERFSRQGCSFETPDLEAGDFLHLTLGAQLRVVEKVLQRGAPAILFGSSMGGYLAALAATRWPGRVQKLVLLAPAFGFYSLWTNALGPEKLADWRRNGTISVFHYRQGKEMPLAFDLMLDAGQFAAFPEFGQPALIFHGVNDSLVPPEQSRAFARSHANVQLIEFDSGHELTDVLEKMWIAAEEFVLGKNEGRDGR